DQVGRPTSASILRSTALVAWTGLELHPLTSRIAYAATATLTALVNRRKTTTASRKPIVCSRTMAGSIYPGPISLLRRIGSGAELRQPIRPDGSIQRDHEFK